MRLSFPDGQILDSWTGSSPNRKKLRPSNPVSPCKYAFLHHSRNFLNRDGRLNRSGHLNRGGHLNRSCHWNCGGHLDEMRSEVSRNYEVIKKKTPKMATSGVRRQWGLHLFPQAIPTTLLVTWEASATYLIEVTHKAPG